MSHVPSKEQSTPRLTILERTQRLLEQMRRGGTPFIGVGYMQEVEAALRTAHEPEASKPQFMECDACRAKAGSPTLCAGCLHNRRVIGQLSAPPVSPTARRCACDPLPPVRELWRVLPDELQGVANAALTAVLEHRCPDESDAYDPPRCAHAVPTDPANPCRGGLFHDFSRASPPPGVVTLEQVREALVSALDGYPHTVNAIMEELEEDAAEPSLPLYAPVPGCKCRNCEAIESTRSALTKAVEYCPHGYQKNQAGTICDRCNDGKD